MEPDNLNIKIPLRDAILIRDAFKHRCEGRFYDDAIEAVDRLDEHTRAIIKEEMKALSRSGLMEAENPDEPVASSS